MLDLVWDKTMTQDTHSLAQVKKLQIRLNTARRAFSTRRVDLNHATSLDNRSTPVAGDLVLAKVEKLGQHQHLESPEGRRQLMYEGNEIIVAYGNRYAPDQFDAVVPHNLEDCDLVAGGGIAAVVRARHSRMKAPTRLRPVGLLKRANGQVINLSDYALPLARQSPCPVIAIVGTSMNAGKTTTAAGLIRGLSQAGLKVGAAKVTGTGSGGDLWSMHDAGAKTVLDFTDKGFATTAGAYIPALEMAAIDLIGHAAHNNDIVVIEIADGLFQSETAALLSSPAFTTAISAFVLAAGDAMGAAFGASWLTQKGLPLSFISGCLSASPLGIQEAERATGLRVARLDELRDPIQACVLCLSPSSSDRQILNTTSLCTVS